MYRLRTEDTSPLDSTISYTPAWSSGDEPTMLGPVIRTVEPGAALREPSAACWHGTVMVVEPVAPELQRLAQALAGYGYRVVPVEDGHTALDWAEVFRPQAIVLSCSLPDFDARDLLLWLRQTEHGRAARIVLVVAPGQPLSAEDRARATAVLQRPPDICELLATLAQDGLVASSAADGASRTH